MSTASNKLAKGNIMDDTELDKIKNFIAESVRNELAHSSETGKKFLTPDELVERWSITHKTLDNWRLEGKPPVFLKVQGSRKALVRYPLHGKDGILDVERKWLRKSTSDDGSQNE